MKLFYGYHILVIFLFQFLAIALMIRERMPRRYPALKLFITHPCLTTYPAYWNIQISDTTGQKTAAYLLSSLELAVLVL